MTTDEPERKRFDVPVYELDDDTDEVEPRLAPPDADEYVEVWYDDLPVGGPNVRCKHVQGDKHTYYDFRITDEALNWCRYQDGDPTDLPVPVRHAVAGYGYGLECDDPDYRYLFEAIVLNELMGDLEEYQSAFSDCPLLATTIDTCVQALNSVYSVLLARGVLSEDTLEDAAAMDDPAQAWQYLEDAVTDTVWGPLLENDSLADGYVLHQRSSAHGPFVQVDVIVETGAYRFQFQQEGESRCVRQRPTDASVPTAIVSKVREKGYSIANIDVHEPNASPDVVSRRTLEFIVALWEDRALAPLLETLFPQASPLVAATGTDTHLTMLMKCPEGATDPFAKVHEKLGIEPGDDIDPETAVRGGKMLIWAVQPEVRHEMIEYVANYPDPVDDLFS